MPNAGYQARLVDRLLHELFAELPALAVTGPRAAGKTTAAARLARTVVRLDRPAEAAAFRADPDAALGALTEPVLLDEWQEVPAVLGTLKRAVDDDHRPGRFLLTGSVRADLEEATWPGTGRIVRIPMFGMTVRELRGGADGTCFLDRVAGHDPLPLPTEVPDLPDYVGLALAGGSPEPALHMGQRARSEWLESYVDQVVTRDAPAVHPGRDPIRLRRYFESLARNTAGTPTEATVIEAAGVNRRTADAYEGLLTARFLTDAVPSWTSNRLRRLSARPKRYVVDPALTASLLRVDELGGGRVIALEVKATASPARDDARHLTWLRDRLQDRFTSGIVLHTGPRPFALDDRIRAVPICALWG